METVLGIITADDIVPTVTQATTAVTQTTTPTPCQSDLAEGGGRSGYNSSNSEFRADRRRNA